MGPYIGLLRYCWHGRCCCASPVIVDASRPLADCLLGVLPPFATLSVHRNSSGAVQFVVRDFETQYLLAGPSDHKRKSATFEVGGYTWCASPSCTHLCSTLIAACGTCWIVQQYWHHECISVGLATGNRGVSAAPGPFRSCTRAVAYSSAGCSVEANEYMQHCSDSCHGMHLAGTERTSTPSCNGNFGHVSATPAELAVCAGP